MSSSVRKGAFQGIQALFSPFFNQSGNKAIVSEVMPVKPTKRGEETTEHYEKNKEMHDQQFIRNTAFFGYDGQKRIEDSFIVIVGLGGVGSHTAHMLARSGVGHFLFVDFDVVTVSSLNRHSVATRKDIGKLKVDVMKEHLMEINPDVIIDTQCALLSKDNLASIITGKPDFIVDCIDDFTTKTDLLEYCIKNDMKVISSMGSGCRSNTTSLLVTNLTDVKYDPLAAKIRYNLKKRKIDFESPSCVNPSTEEDCMKEKVVNSHTGVYIPCVSSYEKPAMKQMSYDASKDAKMKEDAVMDIKETPVEVPTMRYCTIPVYACVPAAYGNTICSYILHSLAHKPFRPSSTVPLSQDVLLKLFNRLLSKEKTLYHNATVEVDRYDIYYLTQTVFKQRCIFTDKPMAGNKLEFTRWDASKPPALNNLVLGCVEAVKNHEAKGMEGMEEVERNRIQRIIDENCNPSDRQDCYYYSYLFNKLSITERTSMSLYLLA